MSLRRRESRDVYKRQGYVSASGRCQLSADTITKLDAAYEKVKAGDIVPAANFNGITPDDFTVE